MGAEGGKRRKKAADRAVNPGAAGRSWQVVALRMRTAADAAEMIARMLMVRKACRRPSRCVDVCPSHPLPQPRPRKRKHHSGPGSSSQWRTPPWQPVHRRACQARPNTDHPTDGSTAAATRKKEGQRWKGDDERKPAALGTLRCASIGIMRDG